MPVYKSKNKDFFKKWAPEMAYVLGFIVADGNLLKNKRGAHFIEIQSTDKEIIFKIRKLLQSNIKIGEYTPKNKNHNKRYRIQIGSKEIFNDLVNLGITPKKSKTIALPKIPDKLFSHFIRGYFDGDGCVSVGEYQKKNRKKLSTIISSNFVSGSKELLTEIYSKLKKGVVTGGTFYYSGGYRLSFSINDSFNLYKLMYNDSKDLFLTRKKRIFENFFKNR